jgi:hypothetical protein
MDVLPTSTLSSRAASPEGLDMLGSWIMQGRLIYIARIYPGLLAALEDKDRVVVSSQIT